MQPANKYAEMLTEVICFWKGGQKVELFQTETTGQRKESKQPMVIKREDNIYCRMACIRIGMRNGRMRDVINKANLTCIRTDRWLTGFISLASLQMLKLL